MQDIFSGFNMFNRFTMNINSMFISLLMNTTFKINFIH